MLNISDYDNNDTNNLLERYRDIISREVVTKDFDIASEDALNFFKIPPITFSKDISLYDIKYFNKITIELKIMVAKRKNC